MSKDDKSGRREKSRLNPTGRPLRLSEDEKLQVRGDGRVRLKSSGSVSPRVSPRLDLELVERFRTSNPDVSDDKINEIRKVLTPAAQLEQKIKDAWVILMEAIINAKPNKDNYQTKRDEVLNKLLLTDEFKFTDPENAGPLLFGIQDRAKGFLKKMTGDGSEFCIGVLKGEYKDSKKNSQISVKKSLESSVAPIDGIFLQMDTSLNELNINNQFILRGRHKVAYAGKDLVGFQTRGELTSTEDRLIVTANVLGAGLCDIIRQKLPFALVRGGKNISEIKTLLSEAQFPILDSNASTFFETNKLVFEKVSDSTISLLLQLADSGYMEGLLMNKEKGQYCSKNDAEEMRSLFISHLSESARSLYLKNTSNNTVSSSALASLFGLKINNNMPNIVVEVPQAEPPKSIESDAREPSKLPRSNQRRLQKTQTVSGEGDSKLPKLVRERPKSELIKTSPISKDESERQANFRRVKDSFEKNSLDKQSPNSSPSKNKEEARMVRSPALPIKETNGERSVRFAGVKEEKRPKRIPTRRELGKSVPTGFTYSDGKNGYKESSVKPKDSYKRSSMQINPELKLTDSLKETERTKNGHGAVRGGRPGEIKSSGRTPVRNFDFNNIPPIETVVKGGDAGPVADSPIKVGSVRERIRSINSIDNKKSFEPIFIALTLPVPVLYVAINVESIVKHAKDNTVKDSPIKQGSVQKIVSNIESVDKIAVNGSTKEPKKVLDPNNFKRPVVQTGGVGNKIKEFEFLNSTNEKPVPEARAYKFRRRDDSMTPSVTANAALPRGSSTLGGADRKTSGSASSNNLGYRQL